MASGKNDLAAPAKAGSPARSRPEMAGPSPGEIRARAARYRRLCEVLHDRRVIAEVLACARDLDAEAALIERRQLDHARLLVGRRRIVG